MDGLSLTEYIALMFGLYLLASGGGLLFEREGYNAILQRFRDDAALGYLAGIMAFALGAVLVRLHNLWGTPVECVVSFIGWAALVEGVLMLAFRQRFMSFFAGFDFSKSFIMGVGLICLLVGGWLVSMVMM